MRRAVYTAWGLFLLLLSLAGVSCVPSANPVSHEKTSKIDSQLVGRWHQEGGEAIWDARKWPGTENTLEVVQVRPLPEEPGGKPPVPKRTFTTLIGEHRVLSFEASSPGSPEVFWIARYELPDPDTLQVYQLDIKAIAAAIKDAKLRGTVKTTGPPGKIERQVTLDETSENIAAYVRRHGASAFVSEPIRYRRLKTR